MLMLFLLFVDRALTCALYYTYIYTVVYLHYCGLGQRSCTARYTIISLYTIHLPTCYMAAIYARYMPGMWPVYRS